MPESVLRCPHLKDCLKVILSDAHTFTARDLKIIKLERDAQSIIRQNIADATAQLELWMVILKILWQENSKILHTHWNSIHRQCSFTYRHSSGNYKAGDRCKEYNMADSWRTQHWTSKFLTSGNLRGFHFEMSTS